ncbi:MAG: type II secretion system protein N [Brachymonas sp.]|nr:type II secretion system protein N [Brachymonas sp.]
MRRTSSKSSSTQVPHTPSGTAWLGAGLGAIVATLVFAPAAWLSRGVDAATGGRVLLAEPVGSVWRGSAQLFLTGGQGTQDAASLPGRVNWRLSPTWRGLNMALDLPCCATQPVQLTLTPGWQRAGVQINAPAVNLPAQWLSGLGAPWNTLGPAGQLTLSAPTLQLDWAAGRVAMQGNAQLDLLDMSSRLSTLSPLGDYRLLLSGGDVPAINLQTLQGALQLSGSGQIVGSRIRFAGEASAAQGSEAALGNVLNIIGRRQGAKSLITLG